MSKKKIKKINVLIELFKTMFIWFLIIYLIIGTIKCRVATMDLQSSIIPSSEEGAECHASLNCVQDICQRYGCHGKKAKCLSSLCCCNV